MPEVRRRGEEPSGLALPDVGQRVEGGEVSPDDLIRLVPVDVAGARVPADHQPFRVEHGDGVVVDSLDEQPKALLRVQQRRLAAAEPHAGPGEGLADQNADGHDEDGRADPGCQVVCQQR